MYGTLFNTNKVSSLLAPAINKEFDKAEVSFLALGSCLHNSLSFDNDNTLLD